MKAPSEKEEALLIAAVKQAADLVETGASPDDAIVKVATEHKLTPGMISILCQGYNTGRQLDQMRSADTALQKYASFPLASPARVIAAVFGSKAEKRAYELPPAGVLARRRAEHDRGGLTKAAADAPGAEPAPKAEAAAAHCEPAAAQRRAYGKYERAKRAYEEGRRAASAAEDRLRVELAKLAADMVGGPPLATVEAVSRNKFGAVVGPLFDALAAMPQFARQKRAQDAGVIKELVDPRQAPYSTVARCVELGRGLHAARLEQERVYAEACKSAEDCGLPFASELAAKSGAATSRRQHSSSHPSPAAEAEERSLLKDAFLNTPAFGMAAGQAIGKIVGDVPKTKADMIEDQWLELEDPAHHNELRKIRAHAMLNSMMTDPDDPISGFEPDQVVTAFNEINQLAPRLAEQPAVMRPLLQRRLQGNVQPFEAKEIADIEKGIAATRVRTPTGSLLQNAPDSLLG